MFNGRDCQPLVSFSLRIPGAATHGVWASNVTCGVQSPQGELAAILVFVTLFSTSGTGDPPGVGVDRESSQRVTHRPDIRITQPDGGVSPTIQAEAISRDTQGRHADHPPWWEWTPPFRTQGIERITPARHADHPA